MADGRLIGIVVRNGLMSFLRRLANVVSALGLVVLVACPLTAQAISPADLGVNRPDERVLDDADVFSRASRSELNARLQDLASERVDARVVTLRRLDYGLNLDGFGEELLEQWSSTGSEPLLLLLIETQNKRASIAADASLQSQLPEALLTSTARTTMSVPLRTCLPIAECTDGHSPDLSRGSHAMVSIAQQDQTVELSDQSWWP